MMLREGGGDVAGGGGGEGGGVGSYSMRGKLLVGRYQRESGMPLPFTADQQRIGPPSPNRSPSLQRRGHAAQT